MPKLAIEVNDYNLASNYAHQIWMGSAFAFVAPAPLEDNLQAGLANFYGLPKIALRHTLPITESLAFPGFKVQATNRPLKPIPVLLPDKEIYRAGEDNVRLLLVAPGWLFPDTAKAESSTARLVIGNNGVVYRTQTVTLNEGGLTLVELGKLPEGNYQVSWDSQEITDHKGNKAECSFSSVTYVLSPLQATLLAHQLQDKKLSCRLKVERFNEPLNEQVQIELWSGQERLGQQRFKPDTPGIFNAEFKVKSEATERLELRVSYLDQLATVVIPGSRKAERDETLLSGLGKEVRVSLMPGEGTREVRGLYLNDDNLVKNTPVTLTDPAPDNRRAQVRWQVATQAARVLVLDLRGAVVESKDLGEVVAGQEVEIEVPAPGGFLAVGGWMGDKAWEGWAVLLAPAMARLEVKAPVTARPGQEVELKLVTESLASVYLLVRDNRLAGSGPQERLAASLKGSLEGANEWGTTGYVNQTLDNHPDWPRGLSPYGGMAFGQLYPSSPPPPMMPQAMPSGVARSRPRSSEGASFRILSEMTLASPSPKAKKRDVIEQRLASFDDKDSAIVPTESGPTPRKDFADVAYCAVIQANEQGEASVTFQLPDAITSYSIEAFALSQNGAEWSVTHESLEVSQPLWAEFNLPTLVYPGDQSPATLEVGCKGGEFRLRLLCDEVAVPFSLSGANQTGPNTFSGHRAKITFEAHPGKWWAELEDLTTHEQDVTERTVEAIGQFKALARRFKLVLTGETISRSASGALQMRLLPSLDKPFNVLCDSTANYGHRCCEQTAAKLIAAVAALMAGGEQTKLRDVILAGVEREKQMHVPGRGLMMYPPQESGGNTSPDNYWGKRAAEHLCGLALIGKPLFASGTNSYDPVITKALQEIIEIGQDAAKAYKLEMLPTRIENGRDAYRAVAGQAASWGEALEYARRTLKSFAENQANASRGAVLNREEQAYCAAAVLAGSDQSNLGLAVEAANQLASSLNGEGRLYSTVDSVALISLMSALRAAGIGVGGKSGSRVRLDGQEMSLSEALEVAAAGQSEEITVLEGAALVELTSEISEDWNTFRAEVPVGIQLARPGIINLRPLRVGDSLDLVVKLEQYEPGLLAHVCLPPALSKIEGGGEVKKFSVDFSGRTEVRIPLRATGHTLPAGEHWAILIRNMFKEEQAGNPGLQLIRVSAD